MHKFRTMVDNADKMGNAVTAYMMAHLRIKLMLKLTAELYYAWQE